MRGVAFAVTAFLLGAAGALAQGVVGTWQTPAGGLVSIYRCGAQVCATVVQLDRRTTDTTDVMNPKAELRTRPLCGLEVGRGFNPVDAAHAEGGELYDPNSGKTYRGSMTAESANMLKLRGYVGVKLFGRTETWTRPVNSHGSCNR